MSQTKKDLAEAGLELVNRFIDVNKLPFVRINISHDKKWNLGECGYYRANGRLLFSGGKWTASKDRQGPVIEVNVPSCASPGMAGRSWSWPASVIDRTPYGVLAHELGHHVDHVTQNWLLGKLLDLALEDRVKLTNYCPNEHELFAEFFRLFVTNPQLLRALRPKVHSIFSMTYFEMVTGSWQTVLKDAPERTRVMVERKIARAHG